MMEKIVGVGSWDSMTEKPAEIVKVSRRGLIGADRKSLLKRAGHVFADQIDNLSLSPGDIPIHMLAIGATEGYGPNRNGDGFAEYDCERFHDRFVKQARFYRNHNNKNPKKSYGYVKMSAYNKSMRRVELLVIGNGDKEAADRNGGLVLDDRSIAILEDGGDLPVSMSCKVAFDVCSNCLNKAAHRGEYCTADTCVSPHNGRKMPGCRDGLTKLGEDGMQQYVDNPNPQWFDISRVFNNADRIGFGNTADYIKRAKVANRVPGGAELAEMYATANGYDIELMTPSATMEHMEREKAVKIASVLAVIEEQLSSGLTASDNASVRALDSSIQSPMNFDEMGKIGSAKQAASLGALASQKIVLPLNDFVRLLTGEDAEKSAAISAKVAPHLRGVFSRMAADPELREKLAANPIQISHTLASAAQQTWANKLAADFSLDSGAIRRRVERATINTVPCPSVDATGEKQAATGGPENDLACWYAAYKIAALTAMPFEPHETELTTRAVVLQNMV